jgi:hypothetical protein
MPAAWLMRANCFVWHIADTALDAIVDADLAHGPERFVVKSWDAQRGPQFFVEPSQIFKMRRQRRQLQAVIGQQELLVACVPKAGEAALQHDRGHDRHLVEVVRAFAKLPAAAVFLDTNDAASTADGKAQRRQAFNLLGCKPLFDIPHNALSLLKANTSVKRTAISNC